MIIYKGKRSLRAKSMEEERGRRSESSSSSTSTSTSSSSTSSEEQQKEQPKEQSKQVERRKERKGPSFGLKLGAEGDAGQRYRSPKIELGLYLNLNRKEE